MTKFVFPSSSCYAFCFGKWRNWRNTSKDKIESVCTYHVKLLVELTAGWRNLKFKLSRSFIGTTTRSSRVFVLAKEPPTFQADVRVCYFSWQMDAKVWFCNTFITPFLQLSVLSFSTWVVIFMSIFLAKLAHFLLTSFTMMRQSYSSVKNFDGPPSHWLKGHTDWVSVSQTFTLFSRKSVINIRLAAQENVSNLNREKPISSNRRICQKWATFLITLEKFTLSDLVMFWAKTSVKF